MSSRCSSKTPTPSWVGLAADRITAALRAPFAVEGKEVVVTASLGIAVRGGGDDRVGAAAQRRHGDVHGEEPWQRAGPSGSRRACIGRRSIGSSWRPIYAARWSARRCTLALPADRLARGWGRSRGWRRSCAGSIPDGDFCIPRSSSRWLKRRASSCRSVSGSCARRAARPRSGTRAGARRRRSAIAVNVSGQQLQHPGIVDVVQRALLESGLAAACSRARDHRECADAAHRDRARAADAAQGSRQPTGDR